MKRLIGLTLAGIFTCYVGFAQTTKPTEKTSTDIKSTTGQYDTIQQNSMVKGREKISEGDIPEKVMDGFHNSKYGTYTITEVYKLSGDATKTIPTESTGSINDNLSEDNIAKQQGMNEGDQNMNRSSQNMSADTTGMNDNSATTDTYTNKDWQNSDNMESDSTAMENNTEQGKINDRSRENATTDTYANKNWENSDNMEADSSAMENNARMDNTQANTNTNDMSGMEDRVFYEIHVATPSDNAVLFFSEEGEIYDTSVGGSTGE